MAPNSRAPRASAPGEPRVLARATGDRLLAGVCGGLAEHLRVPVAAVRISMLVFVLLGGAGALFYAWLWATVPLEGERDALVPLRRALTKPAASGGEPGPGAVPLPVLPPVPAPGSSQDLPVGDPLGAAEADSPAPPRHIASRPARWPVAELSLGACLLIVGVLLVLQQQFGVELRLAVILPSLAVLVGVGLTWWQIADRHKPEQPQMPRVLGALALVAVGVLTFFLSSNEPNMWTVIAASLAVLAGVSLALAPWLLRMNQDLIAERAGRAREAERAEIAAHLHDSVLQTLALIQQRSAPGSEVARIARGQERELREWLFRAGDGGSGAPRGTIAEELRAHAALLERDFAVRFENVEVGVEAVVPEAIVAAAREAMLNAARHAGGHVTVYTEVTSTSVSIDVTDRGSGIDRDAIPEGRMGVRESILGRMTRAGGTAKLVAGPGGQGTSVRLSMARDTVNEDLGGQE